MNIFYVYMILIIFHFAAINGISLVTGKAKSGGLLEDNKFFFSTRHILGFFAVILGGTALIILEQYGQVISGIFICFICYCIDIYLWIKFFMKGKM